MEDLFRQVTLKNGLEIARNLQPGQKNVLSQSNLQPEEASQYADIWTAIVLSYFLFAMALYPGVQAKFGVAEGPRLFCNGLVTRELVRLLVLHRFDVDEQLASVLAVWVAETTQQVLTLASVQEWIESLRTQDSVADTLLSLVTRTSIVAIQRHMQHDEEFRRVIIAAMQTLRRMFAEAYPSV